MLGGVLRGLGSQFGFTPTEEEIERFSLSIRDWAPFTDSEEALRELQRRYRLALIEL